MRETDLSGLVSPTTFSDGRRLAEQKCDLYLLFNAMDQELSSEGLSVHSFWHIDIEQSMPHFIIYIYIYSLDIYKFQLMTNNVMCL